MFLPLYPFEDWLGIKALLWLPIVGMIGPALVPALDRYRSSSLRTRWILLVAAALVIGALIALAVYAQVSAPAQHVPAMQEH